ncbi:hypothetical protein P4S68_10160 [Pseudoalteromonas sp. Hal099]
MSNKMQLPIQLQKLGSTRFAQLYPQQPIQEEVVKLCALSDFAFRSLESQPQLKDWLINPDEQFSRDVPAPFDGLDLQQVDENQCNRILRQYREKYWLKVAYLDLCCDNPNQ